MPKTIDNILSEMQSEMPYKLPSYLIPYIGEAMKIYAEQEAKAFAKFMLPIGKPNKIDENWILFKQPF